MKIYDSTFKDYLTTHFPEHANRIFKANSRAWFSRIFFPMFFFLVPVVFFVGIGFFLYSIKQPGFFAVQSQDKLADFVQSIPLRNTLISIGVTGGFVSLVCFFIGLLIGFSRAHYLLFEAEKLELSAKKLWHTEKNFSDENQQNYLPKVRELTARYREPGV